MTTRTNVVGRIKAALSGGTSPTAAEYAELIDAAAAELAALRAEYTTLTAAMLTDDTVIPRRQQIAGQIEATAMRLAALQSARQRATIGEVEAALMVEIDQQMARRRERFELLRQLEALDVQRSTLARQIRQLQLAKWEDHHLRLKTQLQSAGVTPDESMQQVITAAQARLFAYVQQQEAMLPREEVGEPQSAAGGTQS